MLFCFDVLTKIMCWNYVGERHYFWVDCGALFSIFAMYILDIAQGYVYHAFFLPTPLHHHRDPMDDSFKALNTMAWNMKICPKELNTKIGGFPPKVIKASESKVKSEEQEKASCQGHGKKNQAAQLHLRWVTVHVKDVVCGFGWKQQPNLNIDERKIVSVMSISLSKSCHFARDC